MLRAVKHLWATPILNGGFKLSHCECVDVLCKSKGTVYRRRGHEGLEGE
jgi:hypothetical protein